ncbi:MAG: tRNA (adenosine(37)-N6)-dimethylallyltransferase MiaA [Bacteroidales bacterium]|nr:tRNA (adenosine(37)-N6)-dimethylallyltransferase MiaA [Bacteroidales bacterium]
MKKLVVIAGPTAVGKTAYAVALAQKSGTEIVSCDSRQFYREMKIGVARPDDDELAAVRHHFIACRSVEEPYDVYRYGEDAAACVNHLLESHDTAIAVGGSGLYITALGGGIAQMPDPAPGLREHLQQMLRDEGIGSLRSLLMKMDPEYYSRVDLANPARLQRALEVCITAGRPYSEMLRESRSERPFAIEYIVLATDTDTLRSRINSRVDRMVADGLVDEVESLTQYRHLNTLNTVGYREIFGYLDGTTSLQQAIEAVKLNTWHYAKKQLTWFRKYLKDALWMDPAEPRPM